MQMLACLVILGCVATLTMTHPAPQDEDSGRSAEEVKSDQPKIEPVNRPGQTRPWSVPQLQDTPNTQDKKDDKRSAEESKETTKWSYSTSTSSSSTQPPKTLDEAFNDKKDNKRETEPIAPARLPSNNPTTPSKLNTPALNRPALIRPAPSRPEGTTTDKKDKRGVEAVKDSDDKTTALPQLAGRPIKTEQPNTSDKKDKRSAEETKVPEIKPWQSRPEVTTEQVKNKPEVTTESKSPYVPL